jgi:hypothetical protein
MVLFRKQFRPDLKLSSINKERILLYLISNCELCFTDNYIQKVRKNFMDSRSRRNINRLNDELHDVQRIMVQNIDEVLQRGETLSGEIFRK